LFKNKLYTPELYFNLLKYLRQLDFEVSDRVVIIISYFII
jgi:hypothetical protein